MSEVRICDMPNCGNVFSVNVEDWTTFTGTRFTKDPATGRRTQVTQQLDSCPNCSKSPAPIIAIGAASAPIPTKPEE